MIRIRIVDVEVLFVGEREDGERVCNPVIVSQGDARQGRLAGADHVPSRAVEVGNVSKRWNALSPVRVSREDRHARRGETSGDRPVVALVHWLVWIVALADRRHRKPLRPTNALVLAQLPGEIARLKDDAGPRPVVASDRAGIYQ